MGGKRFFMMMRGVDELIIFLFPYNASDTFGFAGAVDAPVSKIQEGALGALMNIMKSELKQAVEEELADFQYE